MNSFVRNNSLVSLHIVYVIQPKMPSLHQWQTPFDRLVVHVFKKEREEERKKKGDKSANTIQITLQTA